MHHALCWCAAATVATMSSSALGVSIERVSFGGLTTLDYFGAINNRGDILVRIDTPQLGDGLVVRAADGLLIDVGVGFRSHFTPGIADNGDVAFWGNPPGQPYMLVRRTLDYSNDRTLLEWNAGAGGLSQSSVINAAGIIATTREIDDGRSELLLFHPDNTVTTPATFSGIDWRVTGMGSNGSVIVANYASLTNTTIREILPNGIQVTLYSGPDADVRDINRQGQIVGSIRDFEPGDYYDGVVGAVWQSGEFPNPIRVDPIDGAIGVTLTAISDSGIAIGRMFYEGPPGSGGAPPNVPVFWTEQGGLSLLSDLLDPSSGWIVERVYDINDHNVIFGTGLYNGEQASFLLTIPNGASSAPLLLAACLTLRRRR